MEDSASERASSHFILFPFTKSFETNQVIKIQIHVYVCVYIFMYNSSHFFLVGDDGVRLKLR